MIEQGLRDEVAALLAEPAGLSAQAAQAVGYAEMIRHLRGELSLGEAVEQIKINTRQFAKHQRTWFRRFAQVKWIDVAADDKADAVAERVLPLIG
jgi:tRNA dimethylallyltransferase